MVESQQWCGLREGFVALIGCIFSTPYLPEMGSKVIGCTCIDIAGIQLGVVVAVNLFAPFVMTPCHYKL
ncbi:hypothetical protein [Halomonas sp.]|uniref:hypothetical protein n=1 Tax=Halomonas sp. TaxID=1486246 RepID=UPI003A959BA2